MEVGDLVRMRGQLYLVTKVYGAGGLVSLCSFASNQVFREDQLEMVNANR